MESLEEIVEVEKDIVDTNIESYEELSSPNQILMEIPISDKAKEVVSAGRKSIKDILDYRDRRKIVIVGPCSVHDSIAVRSYGEKLARLSGEVKDEVLIVMRTYLEKPRSTIGWKGIIDDPDLDDSNHTQKGIRISRQLLLDINDLGLPCANEFLREDLPQYIADLISWGAIGARNVESQTHRELASGLSMPIGFKNNTAGDIKAAVDATLTARYSHVFLGITSEGKVSRVKTKGNSYSHIVLRGGNGQPNYHPEKIDETKSLIAKVGIKAGIIVDCSHANSNKQYERQEQVAMEVLNQIRNGGDILGIMLESHLYEGKQDFPKTKDEIKNLKYGVSITDSCIGWETTERVIRKYAEELRKG
jgi:3-deoxy-7-phosphoheptulonate synthase